MDQHDSLEKQEASGVAVNQERGSKDEPLELKRISSMASSEAETLVGSTDGAQLSIRPTSSNQLSQRASPKRKPVARGDWAETEVNITDIFACTTYAVQPPPARRCSTPNLAPILRPQSTPGDVSPNSSPCGLSPSIYASTILEGHSSVLAEETSFITITLEEASFSSLTSSDQVVFGQSLFMSPTKASSPGRQAVEHSIQPYFSKAPMMGSSPVNHPTDSAGFPHVVKSPTKDSSPARHTVDPTNMPDLSTSPTNYGSPRRHTVDPVNLPYPFVFDLEMYCPRLEESKSTTDSLEFNWADEPSISVYNADVSTVPHFQLAGFGFSKHAPPKSSKEALGSKSTIPLKTLVSHRFHAKKTTRSPARIFGSIARHANMHIPTSPVSVYEEEHSTMDSFKRLEMECDGSPRLRWENEAHFLEVLRAL